ncbi:MAG: asparagine synthase B [Sediminispirochaetaceae bacterium]
MCGICGVWNSTDCTEVRSMVRRMEHRGPDEQGFHQEGKGMLGHARLSIMDPEGGQQPLCNEDGTIALVANGEIYNYPQLYDELKSRHTFRTGNDSEVILHLYEEEGPALINRLQGMFAFCIIDGPRILLARDAIGIKPLYFGRGDDGSALFTSELKSYTGDEYQLEEFPPGSTFTNTEGFSRFYHVPEPDMMKEREQSPQEYAAGLRKILERAVKRRLMSDVPVGCFLSGGLDSSIISAMVAREIPEPHTFSVGLEGSPDLRAARLVADHIGSVHHEYIIRREEIPMVLPEVVYHLESYDQDLVRSSVPTYFTARLASEYVKVILTGEGADELFGGYTYYKEIEDNGDLHEELQRSVRSLHNINLQRVDRMTMAHSLEGRVPFLDLRMIADSLRIPASLKLYGNPPIEKWVLRKACEDLLPEEIVWRPKEQFDEGTGMTDLLPELAADCFSEEEAARLMERYPSACLRSREEAYYFSFFLKRFSGSPHVMKSVARWAERPDRT